MSSYVKATNFATKDTLPTGNASKIVKGTEIDNEFNAIAGAISSKADLTSPALTGTPTAPTATAGSNTTQLATTAYVKTEIDTVYAAVLQAMYPVGSVYTNATVSTNPSTLLGFGTWTAFGAGRVAVGYDSSDALFNTVGNTGGSKDSTVISHTHTATSTVTDPGHNHGDGNNGTPNTPGTTTGGGYARITQAGNSRTTNWGDTCITTTDTTGITVATTVASTGSSGTNANLPPYVTVYMWKRTA